MARYRIKQFYWAVTSYFTKLDEAYIDKYLQEEEKELFNMLSTGDKHHCVRVAKTAEEYYYQIKRDYPQLNTSLEEVMKIALLHDIGKIVHPLNILKKSLIVLLNKVSSGRLKKLSRIDSIYIYYYHPMEGVKLLRKLGYDENFLYAVEKHHEYIESNNILLNILRYADNKN